MGKPTCYILSGVPGCGKSTWARNFAAKMPKYIKHISRDEIRFSLLKDGEDYFAHEGEVLFTFYRKANEALAEGKSVIMDATHTSERALFETLRRIKVDAKIVFVSFDVPLDTCIARNAQREGLACVPEKVIRTAYQAKQKLNASIQNGKFKMIFAVWSVGEDGCFND